jgi:CheY-like chemotaxis protein
VAADGMLVVTITDTGKGFDPDAVLNRTDPHADGLGLFSIRERLTLLGGRMEIASAPGRGTRTRLIAPRVPAPRTIRRLRILIVDDHPSVVKSLRETLAARPEFDVVGSAGNGIDAISHALALMPDVVLMDVSMPVMDGVEATRRIHAELPAIQIIGVSTFEKLDDVHPIERAGAVAYFRKGVDHQRMMEYLLVLYAGSGVVPVIRAPRARFPAASPDPR